MALPSIAAALYYLFIAAGAVSFGYLLLRLTYPDIRGYSRNEKLGASAVAGIALVILSFAIDAIAGLDSFVAGAGFFPLILFVVSLLAFAVMKLYYGKQAAAQQYITVGVPVTAPEGGEQILIPTRQAPSAAQPQPTATAVPAGMPTISSMEEKPQEKKGREERTRDIEKAIEEIARAQAKTAASAAEKRISARPQEIFAAPTESKPVLVKIPVKPSEFKPLELGEEKKERAPSRGKAEAPSALVILPPPPVPVAKPHARENEKKGENLPLLAGKPVTEALKEVAKAVVSIELPKPTVEEKKVLPELPTAPPASTSYREAREKMRTKEEERKEVPEEPPRRRLYLQPQETKTVVVVAPKELAEKKEFQPAMQDIYSKLQATKKPEGVVESVKEAVQVKKPETLAATPLPITKEERRPSTREREKQAAAPQPEVKLTMEEILGGAVPAKKEEKKAAPVSALQPTAAAAPSGLFAELESIAGGKPAVKKEPEKQVELVKVEAEKGMACPSCGTKNVKVVFCPYCGTANCPNCAANIVVEDDKFVYTCHNCHEEFTVKRKPALPTPATA